MLNSTLGSRFCLIICIMSLVILGTTLALAMDLRIIHINDFHGWTEPPTKGRDGEKLGGAARLAHKVNTLRREKPSLFLAAGDMIQGSSWTNFFKGRSTIELLNLMQLDAMVVGNHEFDFGVPELQARIKEAKFPVLGANVMGFPDLKPFVIKDVQGLKVAIIGLVTPATAHLSAVRDFCEVIFLSPQETMKKFLPQLRKHADVIIVLSHLGFPEDLKLAAGIEGIDVIVGGHSHTRVEKPLIVGRTIIVQAWEHGKAVGILDLQVSDGRVALSGGNLEKNSASGPGDESVQELVKKYQTQVDEVLGQKIGETSVFLDGQNVRRYETNLGNWLADLIRQTAGADLAIINGGGIRRSLPVGPIRLRDIHEIIPFENYIIALEMSGRDIIRALEHGLSDLPTPAARFLQVSGLKMRYDLSAPPGRRLLEVQVGNQPLVDDKIYILATVDFLAAGGDGYSMFPKIFCGPGETGQNGNNTAYKLVYNDPSRSLKQIVSNYVKTEKIISPAVEGRIVENN